MSTIETLLAQVLAEHPGVTTSLSGGQPAYHCTCHLALYKDADDSVINATHRAHVAAELARALRNASKDLAIFIDLIGEDHA